MEHAGVLPQHFKAQNRHIPQNVEILPPQMLGDPLTIQRQQTILHGGVFQIGRAEDHQNAPAVLEAHPLRDPGEAQLAAENVRDRLGILQIDSLIQNAACAQEEMIFLLVGSCAEKQLLFLIEAPGTHTAGGKNLALQIAETILHIRTGKFHSSSRSFGSIILFFLPLVKNQRWAKAHR